MDPAYACMPEPSTMLFHAHKKTISTLQHSLAQQTSLLDAIERSMAVIEFDLQGTVLRANDNFFKTMGYRAEQILGQPHRMFCTPAFAPQRGLQPAVDTPAQRPIPVGHL